MLASLKEVIAEGRKRKIAIGSFNTPNLECLLAVLDAAETLDVPVIIAHAQCHESVSPLDKIGRVMVELAKASRGQVCVHLDHGEDFEYCKKAIGLGFTSVMIDYSTLAYEENAAGTREVALYAHRHGVDVEAELGRLPQREGGASGGEAAAETRGTGKMKRKDARRASFLHSVHHSLLKNEGENGIVHKLKYVFFCLFLLPCTKEITECT